MQWGVGAFYVYCFLFVSEQTHICWHVSLIVFNSLLQFSLVSFLSFSFFFCFCHPESPSRFVRWHIETLSKVRPQVCLVTSLIQAGFIYSCHFLILIIQCREMFLSYSYKVLTKECWRPWKYDCMASLKARTISPCKAWAVAVSRSCNVYWLKLSRTSCAAGGPLRCRPSRQSVWEALFVLFFFPLEFNASGWEWYLFSSDSALLSWSWQSDFVE